MNMMELIKTRKSVRTFDGRMISDEDRDKLCAYIKTIQNPYDIPVEFVMLDAKEHGLSSSVIEGEKLHIAAKVEKQPHGEEAFGFSFEKMVLYAHSLGIGTTWIGGTLDTCSPGVSLRTAINSTSMRSTRSITMRKTMGMCRRSIWG